MKRFPFSLDTRCSFIYKLKFEKLQRLKSQKIFFIKVKTCLCLPKMPHSNTFITYCVGRFA